MLGGSDGFGSRGFVTRMVGLAMWLKGLRASDGRVFRLVDVASLVGLVGWLVGWSGGTDRMRGRRRRGASRSIIVVRYINVFGELVKQAPIF